ncbi:MAG: polysaccharide pyruvyl transferase CsaB [Candidatus Tyrphobacter sp.]
MRLLLSGYYGFGNLGDEAILDVIVAQIKRVLPNVHLDVLSAAPQETAQRLGVEATQRWEVRSVRESIERADALLSGGGGLLQSATSLRSLLYYAGIIRQGVRRGIKTMIFAQSIGPLDGMGTLAVRRLCRGVNRATVRDERSRALLSSLLPQTPVERTADPVFLYDAPPANLELEGLGPASQPYAIVSVREAPGFNASLATIARAVDRLASRGLRVAFLPLGGARDAGAATSVIRACESAPMLLPQPTLARAAAILGGAALVVGMRLHALVLAARACVPFVAIPYDPKIDALVEDLRYPLPALPLVRRGARRPDVESLVDEAVAESGRLAQHLRERIDGVRSLAQRNFDVLADLLASA